MTRNRISIWLLSLVLLCGAGFTPDGVKMVRTIGMQAQSISCDPLGNIYVIKNHELFKYDNEGNLLYTFNNYLSGNIYSVDASDPFKILVFYKDFSQVDILDNTLSYTADPILLQVYNLEQATLVCRSYNNGIWVYDSQIFELIRINEQMEVSDRTGNISQVTGTDVDPNFLVEADNMLYLNDPESGIMVFDKYGTYFRTYPFTGLNSFQVFDGKIMYAEDNMLKIYDIQKMLESSIGQPIEEAADIKLIAEPSPRRLLVYNKTHFYIFIEN